MAKPKTKPESNVGFIFFLFSVMISVMVIMLAWNLHTARTQEKMALYNGITQISKSVSNIEKDVNTIVKQDIPRINDEFILIQNDINRIDHIYKSNAYCVATTTDTGLIDMVCKGDPTK